MKKTFLKPLRMVTILLAITATAYAVWIVGDTVEMKGGMVGGYYANTLGVSTTGAMAVGYNNVSGQNNSATIGMGLATDESESLVVGKYNFYNGVSTAFAVGDGTSNAARSNSFHVGTDGSVTVTKKLILSATVPAGDIPMYVP